MLDPRQQETCAVLSELLSYPRGDAAALARGAMALAGPGSAAAEALARFAAAAGAVPPDALEELYTSTFDLEPTCAPYLGVQLLGDDDPVRGVFLSALAGVYAAEGFRPREELADHVAEVLGFLAVARASAARDDLLRDGLVPALARMIDALGPRENPYRDLLVAARTLLEPDPAHVEPVPVPVPVPEPEPEPEPEKVTTAEAHP